jgi:hypothetical protein
VNLHTITTSMAELKTARKIRRLTNSRKVIRAREFTDLLGR